jgi:hypothetical protein
LNLYKYTGSKPVKFWGKPLSQVLNRLQVHPSLTPY